MVRLFPLKTMAALFALVITVATGRVASGEDSIEERTFPDFSLHTNAGEQWTLSRQGRRPKLLMFWATWCPYCRRLFPEIQALHEDFQGQGLVVAAISFLDDGDTLAYAKQHDLTLTILDDGDALAAEIGVVGTPTTILLDGDNRIVFETRNSDPTDKRLRYAVASAVASYRNEERVEGDNKDPVLEDNTMHDFSFLSGKAIIRHRRLKEIMVNPDNWIEFQSNYEAWGMLGAAESVDRVDGYIDGKPFESVSVQTCDDQDDKSTIYQESSH